MGRGEVRKLVFAAFQAPREGPEGQAGKLRGAGAVAVGGDESDEDFGGHAPKDSRTRADGMTDATPGSMMTAMHVVLGTENNTRSLLYPANRKQLGGKAAAKVAADNAAMGIRTEFGYLPKGWEVCGEFTYPHGTLKARLIREAQ